MKVKLGAVEETFLMFGEGIFVSIYLNLEKAMPVSVAVNVLLNSFASFIHLSAFFNVIVVPSD